MRTWLFPRPDDGFPNGKRRTQTPTRYAPPAPMAGERGETHRSGWRGAIRFFVEHGGRAA